MVDDGEVAGGLHVAVLAQAFVDGREVIKHGIGSLYLLLEIAQYLMCVVG